MTCQDICLSMVRTRTASEERSVSLWRMHTLIARRQRAVDWPAGGRRGQRTRRRYRNRGHPGRGRRLLWAEAWQRPMRRG